MTPEKEPTNEWPVLSISVTPEELNATLPPPEMLEPLTQEEIEVRSEMDWAENDPEIQRLYEGKIIAVRHHRVIAVGDDWKTVIEEAERVSGLPGNLIAIVSIPDPASFFGCH